MIDLAISILWLSLGVLILGGVIWIFLWVLAQWWPGMPSQVYSMVWGAFAILVLIYLLMAISGKGGSFRFGRVSSGPVVTVSAQATGYLSRMLT